MTFTLLTTFSKHRQCPVRVWKWWGSVLFMQMSSCLPLSGDYHRSVIKPSYELDCTSRGYDGNIPRVTFHISINPHTKKINDTIKRCQIKHKTKETLLRLCGTVTISIMTLIKRAWGIYSTCSIIFKSLLRLINLFQCESKSKSTWKS